MELYFLDKQYAAVSAPVDTALSVVWSLRWGSCGTFTVHLPLTWPQDDAAADGFSTVQMAENAVYLCDREHCGRIETIRCAAGGLEISGRLLECLLFDRVAKAKTTYSGTPAEAVMAAVSALAGDMGLVLPDSFPDYGDAGSWEMAAGEVLGEWIFGVLGPLGGSWCITLHENGVPALQLLSGTDRSLEGPDGVSRAIFSEDFGNIASLELERFREDAANCVTVEGSDGTLITCDQSPDAPSRREKYKKAADIRPNDYASTAAYKAALLTRARSLLTPEQLRLSCIGEDAAQPLSGTGCSLGDICEIRSAQLGFGAAVRLTSMDVVYEQGMRKLYPGFGDEVIRVKDWIRGSGG